MPINIPNINPILCFGTNLIKKDYADNQNLVYLTRSDNVTAIISLNGYADGSNSSLNPDTLVYASSLPEIYLPLSRFASPSSTVYINSLSNQANPWKELWASTSINSFQSTTISTRFNKIVDNGNFVVGSTANTYAMDFASTSFFRTINQTFSGTIVIVIVGQLQSDGHLLREYLSTTNYILKHQAGSTAAHTLGCTVEYVKKNGVEVFPQTAGDVHTLFSDDFHLIEIKVSGVNITSPQVNVTGKIEEYIIY